MSPGGVRLIRHDQIDAARFEPPPGRADDLAGLGGGGKTIDDRSQPHVAKMLVAGAMGVQHHGPADRPRAIGYLQANKLFRLSRIKDTKRFGVADRRHAVFALSALPDVIGPVGELVDRFGRDGRIERRLPATNGLHPTYAQPTQSRRGKDIQQASFCGPPAQSGDVPQKRRGMNDVEEQRHGKHAPAGGCEHSGQRFVVSAHAQAEQQGLFLQCVAEELDTDLGIVAVDRAFGDRSVVVGDGDNLVLDPEILMFEDIGASHRSRVVNGQVVLLIQLSTRALRQPRRCGRERKPRGFAAGP